MQIYCSDTTLVSVRYSNVLKSKNVNAKLILDFGILLKKKIKKSHSKQYRGKAAACFGNRHSTPVSLLTWRVS